MSVYAKRAKHQEIIEAFTFKHTCIGNTKLHTIGGQLISYGRVLAWWRVGSIVIREARVDDLSDRSATKKHRRMIRNTAAIRSIPIITQLPR